jgi:hypothetical protein
VDLIQGRVYFRVNFLDQDMMIPEMIPLVFIGRNLTPDQPRLYFQDAGSYFAGERIDGLSAGQISDAEVPVGPRRNLEPWCEVIADGEYTSVYEFESGLESLLVCSLRRADWDGVVKPCDPVPE